MVRCLWQQAVWEMEKYKFKLGMHLHASDRLTFLNIENKLVNLWKVYIVLGSCMQAEVLI